MHRNGLNHSQVLSSRQENGNNSLTQLEPDPLWKKILHGFTDPMIVILLVALAIQVVLFILGQAEWYESAGVFVAIVLANGVAAISESQQEGKAVALRDEESAKDMTKVIREGQLQEIPVNDVVVGDIVFLQAGDKVPADGEIVHGLVNMDQAVLNGETEEITKAPRNEQEYNVQDVLNYCYVYRGTVVCSGEAYLFVKVTGDATLFGKLALEAQGTVRKTPLQVKLTKLAKQITTFGYVGAIAIVLGILAKTYLTDAVPVTVFGWLRLVINSVTVAVTIIVCAVPEGLPMLTSMLLSAQSIRMEKDNVLVKKINGMETSGSLSILFTDKTGTITEGRLSVVEMILGDGTTVYENQSENTLAQVKEVCHSNYRQDLIRGMGLNNSSQASQGNIIGGNSTDRAMLSFLQELNLLEDIQRDEAANYRFFNSHDKYAAVEIKDSPLCYVKGAPEVILSRCQNYIDAQGEVQPLPNDNKIQAYVNSQAERSMRLLAVARGNTNHEENGQLAMPEQLTLVALLSIRDNLRPEVEPAIKEVQNAGIQVVMITGDKKETAVAISQEAGLLQSSRDVVLTSEELNSLTDEEIKDLMPDIRVVARALPTDKSHLVRLAQEMDYVVGMTGDGVNDSPALKKADVGFAMGSGTEVAKEAGDITILDDNFSSLEKAILYGRTMFKSIRKFLIFQLTVNVAAVLICFLGPMLGENIVLTVIQLLLVNLAMDTLAALAFGSEPAQQKYMEDKPVQRQANIVTGRMLQQVTICALYITAICLAILFVPDFRHIFGDVSTTYLKSAVFATFMMAIIFNGFNARTEDINVFENLGRNPTFLIILAIIFVIQFLFVELGGPVLSVEPLNFHTWLICAGLAVLVIPVDLVRRIIQRNAPIEEEE